MRLAGKAALVTGAGSIGIGRAISLAFAREGADVVIHHFRNAVLAEEIAGDIRQMGRRSEALEADLSGAAEGRRLVREAIGILDRLDILVAAAGTNIRKPFLALADEDWDHVHAVNLRSCFVCGQEAARHMAGQGIPGRIIMISSVNQQQVDANMAAYCASKGGVQQLVKAMALELAPLGIRVNLIAPGPVLTDLTRPIMDEARLEATARRVPLGRIGQPEDFAGAAIYLASDESAFVTGASLVVDGGRSLP
jgi:NAD(P)-dependent dehydrogenase (short-subunit alcohol dehydrogenase family)